MELKEIVQIYIIESPGDIDILDNRKEGFALSEILKLADIKNKYFNVINIKTLTECLDRIYQDIKKQEKELGGIVIHFSMHGNKDGVGLTSGEFIDWNHFFKIFDEFNGRLGYIELPNGITTSKISIYMSSCEGYNAHVIRDFSEYPLYTSLVGPTTSVNWSDSLIAFATLYHNTIHKTSGYKIAIEKMNSAAGLDDIFQLANAKGLNLF